jgi:hypothetical protein
MTKLPRLTARQLSPCSRRLDSLSPDKAAVTWSSLKRCYGGRRQGAFVAVFSQASGTVFRNVPAPALCLTWGSMAIIRERKGSSETRAISSMSSPLKEIYNLRGEIFGRVAVHLRGVGVTELSEQINLDLGTADPSTSRPPTRQEMRVEKHCGRPAQDDSLKAVTSPLPPARPRAWRP